MGKTGIQSTFYLDKDAKTCLVEDAKKNNVSLSGMLNEILCKHYDIDNSGYFALGYKNLGVEE